MIDIVDALKAVAFDKDNFPRMDSERVLSVRSALVAAETITALRVDLAAAKALNESMIATLPGAYYMDPPDGGSVMPEEQMQRMAKDAERYRWLRDADPLATKCVFLTYSREELDAAIDAAIAGGKT